MHKKKSIARKKQQQMKPKDYNFVPCVYYGKSGEKSTQYDCQLLGIQGNKQTTFPKQVH